jgi:hypothetical protein
VQVFDMNMDGYRDVAAFGTGQVRIWSGDGAGGWTEIAQFTTPSPGYMQAFRVGGDVDNNGFPDIVLVSEEGSGYYYQNHLHFYKETSTPNTLEINPVFPTGGESFRAGGTIFVDWISAVPVGEIGSLSLELSVHGANGPWESLASALPNNGRFQWRIAAATPSTNEAYLRYVLTTGSGSVEAVTPALFNILGSYEEPIEGLAAANDSPTILGQPTTLTATVITGTNVAYTWALGDSIMISGAVVSYTYPATGIYTATVTAENAVSQASADTTVWINPRPLWQTRLPLVWCSRSTNR